MWFVMRMRIILILSYEFLYTHVTYIYSIKTHQ